MRRPVGWNYRVPIKGMLSMKKMFIAAAAVFAFVCCSASARQFDVLDASIRKTKTGTGHASGTAIAVVKDGKIIHEAYFGFSDIEGKIPVTRNTSFYIASTTKPFFALNALLKVEEGKIDMQTSLQAMFPDLGFKGFDDVFHAHSVIPDTRSVSRDPGPMTWLRALGPGSRSARPG